MARADGKMFEVMEDEVCRMILRRLLSEDRSLTQSQLTAALDLNVSTISRRMSLLEDVGLVEQTGRSRAPYELLFPAKTRELLQAGADLAALALERQASKATANSNELRKEGLAGGNLRDRAKEGA